MLQQQFKSNLATDTDALRQLKMHIPVFFYFNVQKKTMHSCMGL